MAPAISSGAIFTLPDDADLPVLERARAAAAHLDELRHRVLTTYWDTPDRRLARAGVSLRWSGEQWAVDLDDEGADGPAVAGPGYEPPEELVWPLAGHVGGARLSPVLVVDADRRTTRWQDEGGREILVVDDDRVVAERRDDGAVMTWRELRLGTDATHPVAHRLAGAVRGARAQVAAGRIGHALEVLATGADAPERDDLVARRLAELSVTLGASTLAVHRGRADGVHHLRVAVRRSASCLRTFGDLLEPDAVGELVGELSWLGSLLGEVRDAEVLAVRFDRRLGELDIAERLGPVRDDLVGSRRALADAGREAVVTTTGTERFRSLVDELHRLWSDPPYRAGCSGRDVGALGRCVRRELRQVHKRARRAAAAPPGDARDEAFHRVRKAAKRVRYGAETLAPARTKAAGRLARRYEEVQEVLGERHDAVVARRALVGEGARVGARSGHNGFSYGVLAERERRATLDADERWAAVWRRARATPTRKLLGS